MFSLLNPLLQNFLVTFEQGGARLRPEALWLLISLFSLELVLSGMWFVLRREVDWSDLVYKALLAAVLAWMLANVPSVSAAVARGFVTAGLRASGDAITEADIFNPDSVIQLGFANTAVLFQNLTNASILSPRSLAMSIVEGWVAIAIVFTYFLAAIGIFLTLLEFYLAAAFTTILIPFSMFRKTAFFLERAVSHLCGSGLRMGLLAFLLGSAMPVLLKTKIDLAAPPTSLTNAVLLLLSACVFLMLVVTSYVIAMALVRGAPALAVVDAVRSAVTLQHTMQHLSNILERVADTLGRSDPEHPSRQTPPAQRRP